jgi:TPR repeat protein
LQAAASQNVLGMVSLGVCFHQGHGVDKSAEAAAEWFHKAAEMGSPDGLSSLAICSLWGDGVAEDAEGAIRMFTQAAGLGNGTAMVNLGHCYKWGMGVEQDLVAAKDWYAKAADLGDVYGMFFLGNSYCEKLGSKPTELSVPWQRQAQDQELLMGVSGWPIPVRKGVAPEALEVPVLELPSEAEGRADVVPQ